MSGAGYQTSHEQFPPPPPPPGQGYYASVPEHDNIHSDSAPKHDPPSSYGYHNANHYNSNGYDSGVQPYFPPPPRAEFTQPSNGSPVPDHAHLSPRADERTAMTPYPRNDTYAESDNTIELPPHQQAYTYDSRAAPPLSPEYDHRYDYDRYDDHPRYRDSDIASSRSLDRGYHRSYDDGGKRYGSPLDTYSRPRGRQPRTKTNKDFFGQGDGKRGLASAVLGGAAGAWIGHEAGRGPLGTLSGLAVGAIGANVIETQYEKHKEKTKERSGRESSDPQLWNSGQLSHNSRRRFSQPARRRSVSRRRDRSVDSYSTDDSYDRRRRY